MTRCFLSYASSDRVTVESLARDLRRHRYEVWMDIEEIPGGSQWETEINKGLDQSSICIVALTPDALKSEWVKREVEIARSKSKLVIPIILREISLPSSLENLGLADLQCLNFVRYGYEIGMEQLLAALPTIEQRAAPIGTLALVIEDDAAYQEAIYEVFQSLDIETLIVSNFKAALEQIRGKQRFNLITLDMQLDIKDTGGQHGILLLDYLRIYQQSTPVIIISALDWTGLQVRDFLLEYQATDYVKKPFKGNDLKSKIEKALKGNL